MTVHSSNESSSEIIKTEYSCDKDEKERESDVWITQRQLDAMMKELIKETQEHNMRYCAKNKSPPDEEWNLAKHRDVNKISERFRLLKVWNLPESQPLIHQTRSSPFPTKMKK